MAIGVLLVCDACQKEYRISQSKDQHRKRAGLRRNFCSKFCNGIADRVPTKVLPCAACGVLIARELRKLSAHNYCTRTCADRGKGLYWTGEKNHGWRGGLRLVRGSGWGLARRDALKRAGGVCERCGETEQCHLERYGRSLEVHHVIPYRLSLDNSLSNLRVLCLSCHKIEESEIIFTQEQIKQIESNKSLLTAKVRDGGYLVQCPQCSGLKARAARMCQKCWGLSRRDISLRICVTCGGEKSYSRKVINCRTCHLNLRKGRKNVKAA